jgi:threonine synthase
MNVVVPTGNFGNILAAYMAGKMGVPIGKLICASNENKVLTDFINTGIYDARRDFHLTNSPSMDILISSNLERLIYLLSGRDGEAVSNWMKSLEEEKVYEVSEEVKAGLSDFYGGYCLESETLDTIKKLWQQDNYLVDTHTAVAYKVYQDYIKETGDNTATIIASTASAYKFAESVAEALELDKNKVRILSGAKDEPTGFDYVKALASETGVKVPKGLANLESKPILHKGVCKKDEMEDVVIKALS